jgi:hypothetical protein
MPFNGSGTYSLPAGNPAVTGTTISSTATNNTNTDIATALTNCLTRDGQSTPSANLPMNSKKLTGLAAGTSAGDSVRYEQLALLLPLTGGTMTGNINFNSGQPIGTPSSGTLTNCTGLPIVAGTTGTLSISRGGTGLTTSGSGNAGYPLTADGAGGFIVSTPSASSVTRSAKTSAYTIIGTDKGALIEVTSGTFTLSLTAAATLGNGWWCYVSNIGSGLITIDPNASESITVNGQALSTWVQWTSEIGVLQCDGAGFNYYQIQKGYTQQTVSSPVSSISFTSGITGRKQLVLTIDNMDVTASLYLKLRANAVDFTFSYQIYAVIGSSQTSSTTTPGHFIPSNIPALPAGGVDATKTRAKTNISFDGVEIIATSHCLSTYNVATTYTVNNSIGYLKTSTMSSISLVTSTSTVSAGTFTLTEL